MPSVLLGYVEPFRVVYGISGNGFFLSIIGFFDGKGCGVYDESPVSSGMGGDDGDGVVIQEIGRSLGVLEAALDQESGFSLI